MEIKSKRGGARAGAGRPKIEDNGIFLGYKIPEETFQAFTAKCKETGLKKSYIIKKLIDDWLKEEK